MGNFRRTRPVFLREYSTDRMAGGLRPCAGVPHRTAAIGAESKPEHRSGGTVPPDPPTFPPPYPSSSCRTTYAANPRKARTMASARRLVRWWQQQLQLTLGRYMGRSASAWVER